MRATLLLILLLAPSLCQAALEVVDFRSAGDALLVNDTVTGLQWLSPRATNTASYNQVVGGFDGLVTTEGFSVASDGQVLAMFADNFDNPTTTQSVENVPKVLAFFDVFGITAQVTCPATIPPGACPRTQAWSLDSSGDLRGLGMITIGDGAEGYVSDFTLTVAAGGDIIDPQRGTWLVRPAPGAGLSVADFRTDGDRLLITDPLTGLQWLSPRATNTASYNQVIGGFDALVTTEGFSVASDGQVLDLFASHFLDPTTTQSVENLNKVLAFFDVFGITAQVTCPATIPPGACPRTQAWSLDSSGDLRGLGMITIGDGAEGYVSDFTLTVAAGGDIIDPQRGTWLVRRIAPPVSALGSAGVVAMSLLLGVTGVALQGRPRGSRRGRPNGA